MNIESSNINRTNETKVKNVQSTKTQEASVSFADELKDVKSEAVQTSSEEQMNEPAVDKELTENAEPITDAETMELKEAFTNKNNSNKFIQYDESKNINMIDNIKVNSDKAPMDMAIENLSTIVKEFNQSEDKTDAFIKKNELKADNSNMINNDFNVQDNKDILPQMTPNMNFSGNGQPFSSFMNNDTEQNKQGVLTSSAQDLAEESAILSTMAENIAIANKNQVLNDTKTVTNNEGIKKVDVKSGIKVETVVSYDTILMNKSDVEVFTELVEQGQVDLNKLTPQAAERSVKISKTLADMLAKSMENNQPVRINFDNNISVIIRISRDGKITADFLPSSQVAEAYLKENLPLLRQKFDDNNLEYDSLNQRERKNSDKENNRKKDRNNE